MVITERITSVKRHTAGFVINRKEYTRKQAIKIAKQGKIQGVRVCNGPTGQYLSSVRGPSLYSLPTRLSRSSAR